MCLAQNVLFYSWKAVGPHMEQSQLEQHPCLQPNKKSHNCL